MITVSNFFFCIKKGNLICLIGVINKLQKIGLTIQEILSFRYSSNLCSEARSNRHSSLSLITRAVDNNFKSPIEIAIEKKQIDIINAIAEMMPYLLEDKEINNEENSDMYNFAIKTKESTCDAKDN